jgi:hypothetical protein
MWHCFRPFGSKGLLRRSSGGVYSDAAAFFDSDRINDLVADLLARGGAARGEVLHLVT